VSGYASLTQPYLALADTFNVVVQCSDGSHGTFELSQGAPTASRGGASFKVTGKDGWIDVCDANDGYIIILHSGDNRGGKSSEEWSVQAEGVEKEVEWFFMAVQGQATTNIGDPRGALIDVAFIEAGLNSCGEKVSLEKYYN